MTKTFATGDRSQQSRSFFFKFLQRCSYTAIDCLQSIVSPQLLPDSIDLGRQICNTNYCTKKKSNCLRNRHQLGLVVVYGPRNTDPHRDCSFFHKLQEYPFRARSSRHSGIHHSSDTTHMPTTPRPFAFVLMPFSPEFDDTYELAIQPACDAGGAYAERVDKQIFSGSILERVYNQISKADLIVADMSERNPNVFYEVGYAHALGKATILLTKSTDDIPFDLRHYPHIVYNDRLADLKRDLEARVHWHIENPQNGKNETSNVLVRTNGVLLNEKRIVPAVATGNSIGFHINVEIQNQADRRISTAKFQIGLLTPEEFVQSFMGEGRSIVQIKVSIEQRLFLCQESFSILPDAWDAITFIPCTQNRPIQSGETYSFCIRIYQESGTQDFPFVIQTGPEQGTPL